MDGFYEPDRAVAALESNDPKQVAELLETPPWNPTIQEMCLGGFFHGEDSMGIYLYLYLYIYRLTAKTVSASLSQPTGRRESANRKARVSQPEGASQPTGRPESVDQDSASQQDGASQTTRSQVRQPGQPGPESDNQVN